MPRLTTKQYLTAHDHLFGLWSLHKSIFALLTSSEQRALHGFFYLSDPLPEAELLAYRQAITVKYPSLPHQAGKAYRRLIDLEPAYLTSCRKAEAEREYRRSHPAGKRTVSRSKHRRVTARGIVRPQPDYLRLSQAIIDLARDQLRAERSRGGAEKP